MKKQKEIKDYDNQDTSSWINPSKPMKLADIGFEKLSQPSTQVVSIRLPTPLLNQLRAKASSQDIPYQALIKMILGKHLRMQIGSS